MKSGVPWSIGGIDEETREAARLAAERSGLSVSEWLNRTIAERAGIAASAKREDDTRDDADRALGDAVDKLTRRLRSMDDPSRAALSGLKSRLDEIEQGLEALPRLRKGTGDRARVIKTIAGLVAELTRELDNADENARRMIEGLRDRTQAVAGRQSTARHGSVDEAIRTLDQRIAAMSERLSAPPRPANPDRLDEVRQHLDALLAKGTQPQASQAGRTSLDASLRGLEARIDDARARLARVATPDSLPEGERVRRIEAQLADIVGLIGGDAPPAAATARPGTRPLKQAPPAGDDLASAIAEISARQQMLDARSEERAEMIGSVTSLHEEIAGLAEKMTTLGRVGAEEKGAFYDLVRRIDALAAEKSLDRGLLSSIRGDLEVLRGAVDGDAERPGIVERLDSLLDRTPDRGRLDALGAEVAALRQALEATDNPRAIARLEMRFAELARGVESAINGDSKARLQSEKESLARLETTLNEVAARVDGLLDRAPGPDALAAIHDRIADLAMRLEDIDAFQRGPAAALDEIKAELAALRHELAGRAPRTDHLEQRIADLATRLDSPPQNEALELRVAELANRLDTVASGSTDSDTLAELEAQVAYLATELERVVPRTAALEHVEDNLARLQALLSENRHESVEAARHAAREAVSQLAGDRADTEIVAALKADLETIRNATGSSDLQTRQTLGAVHDTLERIVERLGRLEAGEAAAPPAAAREAAATLPRAEAGLANRVGASAAREAEDYRPLEPGSGKPDLAALRELTRTATEAPREKGTGDRKADFIAAARRAAQAAAAEARAAAPAEEEEAAEDKPGAFARIGLAIRNRRRPLLLAAAAIVLAIGALQIFGDRITMAVETATRSEPTINTGNALVAPAPAVKPGPAAIVPKAREQAMVAPAPDPGSAIAFAAPEAFDSRFGGGADGPVPAGFAATAEVAAQSAPVETMTASLSATVPAPKHVAPMPDAGIGSTYLLNAAASGDPAAAFEVAVRYAEGRGVPADLAKAGEWYTRAADGGIAVAQYRLGSLYERGQGVARDAAAAAGWYQRAADQGNVGAMHNLAVMMSEGVDGPPDHAKALQWFQTAAYYGVKDSQYNLGVIHARGIGVDVDMSEAYKWFAVAAAQGDSDAATRRDEIGRMLTPDEIAAARAAVTTWHAKPALAEANAVAAPEGGWDEPAGLVNEKDQRRLVMKIQQLLAEQGYDPGPADGVPGQKTREAVRAFQKTISAAETGEINGDLVTALAGPG
jgi:localization factor PodJL